MQRGNHRISVARRISRDQANLANATQTQFETMRWHQREALLPLTARTPGNYRIDGSGYVDRLAISRHCRSLDTSVHEIRLLLRCKDTLDEVCGDVNAAPFRLITQEAARIRGG